MYLIQNRWCGNRWPIHTVYKTIYTFVQLWLTTAAPPTPCVVLRIIALDLSSEQHLWKDTNNVVEEQVSFTGWRIIVSNVQIFSLLQAFLFWFFFFVGIFYIGNEEHAPVHTRIVPHWHFTGPETKETELWASYNDSKSRKLRRTWWCANRKFALGLYRIGIRAS